MDLEKITQSEVTRATKTKTAVLSHLGVLAPDPQM